MDSVDNTASLKLGNELRRNRREKLQEKQEFNRFGAFERNRFAESDIVTESDISGLCSRIKRRKRASAEDLQRLANAFLQSESNISTFIKVTGAINIIIKEFTGNDRNQQLLAAQCLCNLSLGDEVSCSKIATFAGSYLMIFMLNSNDASFSKMCLWITQNIVAAGSKPMNILMSQELLKNCLHVLNNAVEQEVEAIQLLELIIDEKWSEIEVEQREEILKGVWNVLKKDFDDPVVLQVFEKVSVLNDSWNLNQEQIEQLVTMMSINIVEGMSPESSNEAVLPFALKLLMMAFQENLQNAVKFLEIITENNVKLSDIVNKASTFPKYFSIIKQLMQFIAVLYVNPHPTIVEYFTHDSPETWKIPKIFTF